MHDKHENQKNLNIAFPGSSQSRAIRMNQEALVSQASACFPRHSSRPNFPFRAPMRMSPRGQICISIIQSHFPSRKVYKMTPPYRVSPREEDIMTEIISNGPVQVLFELLDMKKIFSQLKATFVVHEDFFMYKHGVFQHTHIAADKVDHSSSFHSLIN